MIDPDAVLCAVCEKPFDQVLAGDDHYCSRRCRHMDERGLVDDTEALDRLGTRMVERAAELLAMLRKDP